MELHVLNHYILEKYIFAVYKEMTFNFYFSHAKTWIQSTPITSSAQEIYELLFVMLFF